jgi:CDP-diacylglycerol--glycerol-3-phosphate 3-phosphatidyltransferase
MWRQIPNLITAGRLVLACVFFVMLGLYQYTMRGDPWLLNAAFMIYAIALFSDFLDGYLARKWKVESAFGRIVDPFVDKILVIGSFIFLAGKNFIIPDTVHPGAPYAVKTITGVAPGMVLVILARELLVTAFRSAGEGAGVAFGAQMAGKVKMVFQSITILVILAYVNYLSYIRELGPQWERWTTWFRDFMIWGTVVITVMSGLLYVKKGLAIARSTTDA